MNGPGEPARVNNALIAGNFLCPLCNYSANSHNAKHHADIQTALDDCLAFSSGDFGHQYPISASVRLQSVRFTVHFTKLRLCAGCVDIC